MLKSILFLSLLSFQAIAIEVGLPLEPRIKSDGTAALGTSYSTNLDVDGAMYNASISPALLPGESGQQVKLNVLRLQDQTVLRAWAEIQSMPMNLLQYRDTDPARVMALIASQKTDGQLLIVISPDDGQTITRHFSPYDFCTRFPTTFKDLTDGLPCR